MAPRVIRRAGLILAGLVMGLLGLALGISFYLQAARVQEVRANIGAALDSLQDVIEDIEVLQNDAVRVTVRDVALLDEGGDTIMAAPQLAMTLDAPTLAGEGPIEFYDVEVRNAYGQFVQDPSGEWNWMRAMGVTAGGVPVESQDGRPILLRDVRLTNGRVIVALPVEPAPPTDSRFTVNVPLTQIGGVTYHRYVVTDLQGQLPQLLIGGPTGWRADIANLSGQVEEPRMRIAQAQGSLRKDGEDGVIFDLTAMRFGESEFSGAGSIRFTEEGPLYDAELRTPQLRLVDIQPLFPTFPDEGVARFAVDLQSVTAERLGLTFRELDFSALGSRILGTIGLAVGGEEPLAITAADLQLDPLNILTLEQLGFADSIPVLGQLTGRVTSTGAEPGNAIVDLRASLIARNDPSVPASTVVAAGQIQLGSAADALQLDGLVIGLQPLHLAAFRSMVPPAQQARMQGDLRGAVTLGGTLGDIRLAGGELAYEVGGALPTRLNEIAGRVTLDPALSYELSAVASPINLESVVAVFPTLPFRTGSLSGPIGIEGNREGFDLNANLTSSTGGVELLASVDLGETLHFDVEGNVRAFSAGMILQPELPVMGPLTGTFSAQGTTRQFGFNIDLEQQEGTFALGGSVNFDAEPARFDIAGNANEFRVGALIGQPLLFPGPMTGPIELAGGGGDPYRMEVGLEGALGRLDLTGVYRNTAIPSYEIQGTVAGLDLSAIPTQVPLPTTNLTGRIDVRGEGTDTENLAGTFSFDLAASTISNVRLDTALGRVVVADGVANVDTLQIQLEQSMLSASGSWGLRAPASEPLRFAFSSPDLGALARVAPPGIVTAPHLEGSLQASGEVGGSFELPIVAGRFIGRNLRFHDWRAASLDLTTDISRDTARVWSGRVALDGADLVLPGFQNLQALSLEASGNQSSLAFGLTVSRDAQSDIAASGLLELDGMRPREVDLETMALRAEGIAWELLNPARMRYVDTEGLLIENLLLERSGAAEGRLSVNGMIPPTGDADLQISVDRLDLADWRRIVPTAPALEGALSLEVSLEGPVANPELVVAGRIDQLRYEGVLTESLNFNATYTGRLLSGTVEAVAGGQPLAQVQLGIPMALSLEKRLVPAFELLRNDPLSLTVRADSLPLAVLAALTPGITEGSGLARAQVNVTGTLEEPLVEGSASIDNGAVTLEQAGVRWSEIQVNVAMAESRAVINNFFVRSNGTATASGAIGFPAGSRPIADLTVNLDGFQVMNNPDVAVVKVSGQIGLAGTTANATATGNLTIYESTFQVPEFGADRPTLELAYADLGQSGLSQGQGDVIVTPPLFGNFRIDGVQIAIGETVWLESREMRVQIDGALVLYRTAEELRVFGALDAVRGSYSLEIGGIAREFDVSRGRVQFYGTGELNPSLDLLAGYRVPTTTVGSSGDVTVLVHLTGTMLAPRVELTADSSVPLSESDLISYLIFGRPNFELGGLADGGFAEQLLVQEVVGGMLAGELERRILQGVCDYVRIRPGTNTIRGLVDRNSLSGVFIECGVEIANGVFVNAQAGLGALGGGSNGSFTDGRVGIEWQINDQWMLEGTYGAIPRDPVYRILTDQTNTQFSGDLRRVWEYGKPRNTDILNLTPDEPTAVQAGPPPPPTPEVAVPSPEPPPAQ